MDTPKRREEKTFFEMESPLTEECFRRLSSQDLSSGVVKNDDKELGDLIIMIAFLSTHSLYTKHCVCISSFYPLHNCLWEELIFCSYRQGN